MLLQPGCPEWASGLLLLSLSLSLSLLLSLPLPSSLEKEKKYTNDRLIESHAREDALKGEISMLNATIVKLRSENSKMYAEMEDLKAVTINGLVLIHSLIYIKKKKLCTAY